MAQNFFLFLYLTDLKTNRFKRQHLDSERLGGGSLIFKKKCIKNICALVKKIFIYYNHIVNRKS